MQIRLKFWSSEKYEVVKEKDKYVIEKRVFLFFWTRVKGIKEGSKEKEVATFDNYEQAVSTLVSTLVDKIK